MINISFENIENVVRQKQKCWRQYRLDKSISGRPDNKEVYEALREAYNAGYSACFIQLMAGSFLTSIMEESETDENE